MHIGKDLALDINVVQDGGHYVVSGKDAGLLYQKMQKLPAAAQEFILGSLQDGKFTMQKAAQQRQAAG